MDQSQAQERRRLMADAATRRLNAAQGSVSSDETSQHESASAAAGQHHARTTTDWTLGGTPNSQSQEGRTLLAEAATQRLNAANGSASETEPGWKWPEMNDVTATEAEGENAYVDNMDVEYENEDNMEVAYANEDNMDVEYTNQDNADDQAIMRMYMDMIEQEEQIRAGSQRAFSNPSTVQLVDSWDCQICTLINEADHLCCDACGSQRSSV
ncbi:hypothetical protein MMC22_002761 [Lobaria immixta]|nr:hypothetical protein [Lobaria immixta]